MRWAKISAIIVAVQYLAAITIERISGIDYHLPLKGLLMSAAYFSALAILVFAFAKIVYFAATKEPSPVSRMAGDLSHATQAPLALGLFASQIAVLGWLKVMMPHVNGFWADPMLAELDASIFLSDPWVWAHRLQVGAFIDASYAAWGFLVVITFAALAMSPDSEKRTAAFVSYFVLIGLSAMLQYLLPAAGPIFYQQVGHGDRFSAMPVLPMTQASADYLWASYSTGASKVGTGISAMPSVHVAAAAWVGFTCASFCPRLKWAAFAFVVLMWFGSVYLGWHYAVDGAAGLGLMLLARRIARAAARWSIPPPLAQPEARPV